MSVTTYNVSDRVELPMCVNTHEPRQYAAVKVPTGENSTPQDLCLVCFAWVFRGRTGKYVVVYNY